MNRKIVHSILVAATVTVGMGTLYSCKSDDYSSQISALETQQSSLQSKIAALESQLSSLQSSQASCKSECATEIENLRNQISNSSSQSEISALQQKIASLEATQSKITVIEGTLSTIEGNINTLKQDLTDDVAALKTDLENNIDGVKTGLQGEISDAKNELSGQIGDVKDSLDNISNQVGSVKNDLSDLSGEVGSVKDSLENLSGTVSDLSGTVGNLSGTVSDLSGTVGDLSGTVGNLSGTVSDISGNLSNLTDSVSSLKDSFESDIKAVNSDLAGINQRLEGHDLDAIEAEIERLSTSMSTVETNLDALTERVDAILGRLNKLVTGVLVQSTENPVVGSYSSPFNTQSNIVMAYYGTNTTNITEFPTIRSAQEYDGTQVITSADWAMLGKNGAAVKTVKIDNTSDYLMHDAEGNAGKVYITINPNNVDFTGLTATLVNSRDEESGIKLGALQKSDKLLSFGISRSSSDNGFYEATATVTPEQIPNVKINIESGLKSAFKSVLTERSVKSFATLANTVYNQLNNYLPANAVKVGWKADDGNGKETDYAVYSQYNIAATAFKPLSFKFLSGTSVGSLPTISPLSGLTIDKDKFHFNIDLEPFEMKGISIEFNLSEITLGTDNKITVNVTGTGNGEGKVPSTNEVIKIEVEVKANGEADLTEFIKSIEGNFNSQISSWNTAMKDAFDDAISDLIGQINDQVNDMMDSVTGSINDNIDKIVDEVLSEVNGSGIFSRLNSYIESYNSLATRINNLLSNPNHYLQAMLGYEANGSLQFMSTSASAPSPVTLNGGNGITLYATTYTAELVVPTFYKFVGVTNAWANGNQSASAQKGNSGASTALKAANATEYMATPLNGNQIKVPMKLTKGYTYEIVYSALDYQGVTSTRKFYLSVK